MHACAHTRASTCALAIQHMCGLMRTYGEDYIHLLHSCRQRIIIATKQSIMHTCAHACARVCAQPCVRAVTHACARVCSNPQSPHMYTVTIVGVHALVRERAPARGGVWPCACGRAFAPMRMRTHAKTIVRLHANTRTHSRSLARARTRAHALYSNNYVCMCACTDMTAINPHIRACACTLACTHTHVCAHPYTHAYTCAHRRTHAHAHVREHMCAHTHMHARTRARTPNDNLHIHSRTRVRAHTRMCAHSPT